VQGAPRRADDRSAQAQQLLGKKLHVSDYNTLCLGLLPALAPTHETYKLAVLWLADQGSPLPEAALWQPATLTDPQQRAVGTVLISYLHLDHCSLKECLVSSKRTGENE